MQIGVIGKPSCGKSTFFKATTLAEVEIHVRPFTTLKTSEGVAFVKINCVDKDFNVKCQPKHGYCLKSKRFVPITIIIMCIGLFFVPLTISGTEVNYTLVLITIPFIIVALLGLTPINAWSQDLLPENKRGQFTGILNVTFTISQIIGAFVAGIVATILGVQWVFVFSTIFFLGSIPFFLKVKETLELD